MVSHVTEMRAVLEFFLTLQEPEESKLWWIIPHAIKPSVFAILSHSAHQKQSQPATNSTQYPAPST